MSDLGAAVDIEQLIGELNQLAALSDCSEPPPAVTRVVFTETDQKARAMLQGLCEAAGLATRTDAAGNTFFRWVGAEPDLPAVATGSHIDAIPHAGMYDGTVGVLGGLEAIRSLQQSGLRPRRSIELVLFTSEEPTRFGIGCSGSRLMSGALPPDELAALRDADGTTFDAARLAAGFAGPLESAVLPSDAYHAFVELHIEQGPLLEQAGESIGVVTAIAAPLTAQLTIEGQGGHAGGVMMADRADALCAASELVVAIESAARDCESTDVVATVGTLEVHPGAVNSIPSRVSFSLDLRDIDGANRDQVFAAIDTARQQIAERRGVDIAAEVLHADTPASCAERVVKAAREAAAELSLPAREMISRAYHDSLFMTRVAPTGMIFIPCRDGVSHRPDEYSSPEQIAAGVSCLAATLARLAE